MMLMLLQETPDSGAGWPDAVIAAAGIAMVTAIVVVGIWQIFASWRARVSVAREEAYRELVAHFAADQEQFAADLSDIKEHVENIERILREVE